MVCCGWGGKGIDVAAASAAAQAANTTCTTRFATREAITRREHRKIAIRRARSPSFRPHSHAHAHICALEHLREAGAGQGRRGGAVGRVYGLVLLEFYEQGVEGFEVVGRRVCV